MKITIITTRSLELSESDCLSVAVGLGATLNAALNAECGGPGTPLFEQMQNIHEVCWQIAEPEHGDSLIRLSISPEKIRELVEGTRKMKKR